MPTSVWTERSGYNLCKQINDSSVIYENDDVDIPLPITTSNGYNFELLSGKLPPGLYVKNASVKGSPFQVSRLTEFKFVIRATNTNDNTISDRTFVLQVDGSDAPRWITEAGILPLGNGGLGFILDNSIIDYQLEAVDDDLPTGQTLVYNLKSGTLPEGVTLSSSGRLQGLVQCIPSIEAQDGTGTFDTAIYDKHPYDFVTVDDLGQPVTTIKKLNRYYEFTVEVTDLETVIERKFKIYVVGDDFLRASNAEILADNLIFTVDGTYTRTPVWLTGSDLGFKRANNYITLFLDVLDLCETPTGTIDDSSLFGIAYILEPFNPDGTASLLPPGMSLDAYNGEIFGYVKKQPAITKEYKFTVNAIRYDTDTTEVEILYAYLYSSIMRGDTFLRVYSPFTANNLLTNEVAEQFIGESVTIGNQVYTIESIELLTNYHAFYLDRAVDIDDVQLLYDNAGYDTVTYSSFVGDLSTGIRTVSTTPAGSNGIIVYPIDIPLNEVIGATFRWGSYDYKIQGVERLTPTSEYFLLSIANADDLESPLSTSIPAETDLTSFLYKNYSLQKTIITSPSGDTVGTAKTFTIKIIGEVDTTINWITDDLIGTTKPQVQSIFAVEARSTIPNAILTYTLTDDLYNSNGRLNKLPPGLTLSTKGYIKGTVNQYGRTGKEGVIRFYDTVNNENVFTTFDNGDTTFDREYTFTVTATDQYNLSSVTKTFQINVDISDPLNYSNIYVQAMPRQVKRTKYQTFVTNTEIFKPDWIYRSDDPDFGIQTTQRVLLFAGIETKQSYQYAQLAETNFKRKRLNYGDVKSAVAWIPGTKDPAYEVVYVEMIDPYHNVSQKIKLPSQVNNPISINNVPFNVADGNLNDQLSLLNEPNVNIFRPKFLDLDLQSEAITVDSDDLNAVFPSSIQNMRNKIKQAGGLNQEMLPLWMLTPQTSTKILGYTLAMPLCYCKPGYASSIINLIKASRFDFKTLDFEFDRYIINATSDLDQPSYIRFSDALWNT